MEITYIGNGSSGNATYFSDGPTSLLIDNGLALKRVPFEVNGGVLISHMHSDHMDGVEKYVKKYQAKTGIRAIVDRSFCAELKIDERYLQYQDFTKRFNVGTIQVEPFGVWHDEVCFGFLLNDKYIHLTDTGKIPFTLAIRLKKYPIEALYIECNYDEEMIDKSDYDEILKNRIKSRVGHLSNQETLGFLADNCDILEKVSFIVLGHLSDNTNSVQMLEQRIQELLPVELHKKVIIGEEGTNIKK